MKRILIAAAAVLLLLLPGGCAQGSVQPPPAEAGAPTNVPAPIAPPQPSPAPVKTVAPGTPVPTAPPPTAAPTPIPVTPVPSAAPAPIPVTPAPTAVPAPIPVTPVPSAAPAPIPVTPVPTAAPSPAPSTAYIGADAARTAALTHAGTAADVVFFSDCELELKNGLSCYDLEFCWDGREYDYEVDALTGAILYCGIGRCDHAAHHTGHHSGDPHHGSPAQPDCISPEAARKTVCDHLGVFESDMLGCTVELEQKDGATIYEVEFCHNGAEYEYEVDALTGAVLKFDVGRCDHRH